MTKYLPSSNKQGVDERAVELGEWLSAWRRKRGLNRPETVNEALKYDPRAKLSPDYLSKIEYGKRSLASASPEVREALRLALNITKETWENETGLLVPAAVFDAVASAPTRTGPPIPPVVAPLDLPLEIPDELQQVIDRHGDDYPELHNEATLRALVAPRLFAGHSQGPQTAAQ